MITTEELYASRVPGGASITTLRKYDRNQLHANIARLYCNAAHGYGGASGQPEPCTVATAVANAVLAALDQEFGGPMEIWVRPAAEVSEFWIPERPPTT